MTTHLFSIAHSSHKSSSRVKRLTPATRDPSQVLILGSHTYPHELRSEPLCYLTRNPQHLSRLIEQRSGDRGAQRRPSHEGV